MLQKLKFIKNDVLIRKLILILSFFFYLPWFFDTDIWWHLRLGQEILSRSFANNLTFTCKDYIWTNYSWFADVFMYLTYSKIGYMALALLTAFIFFLGNYINFRTLLYWLKAEHNIQIKSNLALMSYMLFNAMFMILFIYVRPQVIAFLFFSILINRLIKGYYENLNIKDYLVIGIMIILWVNTHGSFIIGLAVSIFFLGVYVYRMILHIAKKEEIKQLKECLLKFKNFLMLVPLFIFLPLINPFGLNLWKEVLSSITSNLNGDYISEWASINFHSIDGLIFFSIVVVCCIFILLNKKVNIVRHSLFLIFVFLAFYSVRYQLIGDIIISITLFFEGFALFNSNSIDKDSDYYKYVVIGLKFFAVSFFIILIVLIPFNFARLKKASDDPVANAEFPGLPYKAVQFIKSHPQLQSLRYFNEYLWGGYLDFVYPEKEWFIDGRMSNWTCSDIKESTILLDYVGVLRLRKDWLDILKEYKITGLLIQKDSPLSNVIKYSSVWKEVYSDDDGVVIYQLISPLK